MAKAKKGKVVRKRRKTPKFLTREFWGMTMTFFSVAILAFTFLSIFNVGFVSDYVAKFISGLFGYFTFPLFFFDLFTGIMLIFGKKPVKGKGVATAVAIGVAFVFGFLLTHAIVSPIGDRSLGEYLTAAYTAPAEGVLNASVGGWFAALVIYPVFSGITFAGGIILFSAVILLAILIVFRGKIFGKRKKKEKVEIDEKVAVEKPAANKKPERIYAGGSRSSKRLVVTGGKFEMKGEESVQKTDDFEASSNYGRAYSDEYNREFSEKLDYVKTAQKIDPENLGKTVNTTMFNSAMSSDDYSGAIDDSTPNEEVYIPENYREAVKNDNASAYDDEYNDEADAYDDIDDETASDNEFADIGAQFGFADEEDGEAPQSETQEKQSVEEPTSQTPPKPQKEEKGNPYDEMPLNFKYNPPPVELLGVYDSEEDYGAVEVFKREKAAKILNTLKVLNNINAQVVNIVHGPTITRFDLAIPENVSIKNVTKYTDDLKLRLATKSDIRFTTIPGTPYVGVEVPNDKQATVGLRSVIESDTFKNAKKNSLTFAIGKDIIGNPVVADITKMPHLLIAGATGTGKSVGLNALLVSLMYKYSPAELRFIIIDPKQVEFTIFSGIPHMLFDEIIFEPQKAIATLSWAVKEMESRYGKLREAMVRNIDEYNMQIDPRKDRKMPRIVMIVDEFADLMSVDKKNIEDKIARIAQKARAAGIYLILATQRPSVNIMEGSIKTNFTSRMAFKMSNAIDSNTILNEVGAEKLLGRGDLLYKMSDMTSVERAQGAYVDGEEIKNIVKYLKENNKCYFNEAALADINGEVSPQIENVTARSGGGSSGGGAVSQDNLSALYLAVQLGSVSISLLQRKLHFGFPKAGAIVDWMEREGYLASGAAGRQKPVTLTKEQFDEKYGGVFSVEEFEDRFGLL